jgi:hypothetical protein
MLKRRDGLTAGRAISFLAPLLYGISVHQRILLTTLYQSLRLGLSLPSDTLYALYRSDITARILVLESTVEHRLYLRI